jgi:hypothetical protein
VDEQAPNSKLARNEYVLKQANKRIDELARRLAAEGLAAEEREIEFLCACGDTACREKIHLSLAEYERIRMQPDAFIVRPGHERDDVERVVERHDGYLAVEKRAEFRRA